MNEPRRGEVWMVDLGMTAKVRPCLVISIGATEQERVLATLVPHTTSIRNSRFEVNLKVRFLREGVFDAQDLGTVAEINRETHEAEIQTMARLFADVQTTDEVIAMLVSAATVRS